MSEAPSDARFRALMHRWFVQYNPTYLLSAALVLGGMWVLSREAAEQSSVLGQLGVSGLAELYAFTLIGGAAFLTRAGLRRPAVMLALIAVIYQGDVTLHLETCAYLGATGVASSVAWFALFLFKLRALAWALELRLSRSAMLVSLLGSAGLAALPHALQYLDHDAGSGAVALWIFATGMAALWTRRGVESAVGFDVRGRRAVIGTWLTWAALGLAHAGYWVYSHRLGVACLVAPLLLLVASRGVRRERVAWGLIAATAIPVAVLARPLLPVTLLMASAVLLLRVWRTPRRTSSDAAPDVPYRGAGHLPPPPPTWVYASADASERARLLAGALGLAYLSAWTAADFPAHLWMLDLALLVATAALTWRLRRAVIAGPLTLTALHLGLAMGWLDQPRGALEWGAALVGGGFVVLVLSLALSWRYRHAPAQAGDGPSCSAR